MKQPFKVGDRVRVYYSDGQPVIGVVDAVQPSGLLVVETIDGRPTAHPKQCRRLVKKKRREILLQFDIQNGSVLRCISECSYQAIARVERYNMNGNWIRFVEVKK